MSEQKKINIRNKRATFDYEILEEYVAGIVLVGTEIKSIRAGKASLTDSFCYFDKGELWIRVSTSPNTGGAPATTMRRAATGNCCSTAASWTNSSVRGRTRASRSWGCACSERTGAGEVVVGLARGRKTYDKREYLKENDAKREIDKAMKNYKL